MGFVRNLVFAMNFRQQFVASEATHKWFGKRKELMDPQIRSCVTHKMFSVSFWLEFYSEADKFLDKVHEDSLPALRKQRELGPPQHKDVKVNFDFIERMAKLSTNFDSLVVDHMRDGLEIRFEYPPQPCEGQIFKKVLVG